MYMHVGVLSAGEGAENGSISMLIHERIDKQHKKKSDYERAERQAAEDVRQQIKLNLIYLIAKFLNPNLPPL